MNGDGSEGAMEESPVEENATGERERKSAPPDVRPDGLRRAQSSRGRELGPIEVFLAGRASEEDVARMSDEITNDPALRARFLELTAVEVLLKDHHGGRYPRAAGVSRRRRALRGRRAGTYPWFAVAAVAAGLALALLFWPSARRQGPRTAARPGPSDFGELSRAAAPVPPHATLRSSPLRSTSAARFEALVGPVMYSRAGSGRWLGANPDVRLMTGDIVRTRASRAGIVLRSGSRVYVNHRTLVALANGNGAGCSGLDLSRGETYVEAARGDNGFRVETPHGTVVDYGTRFGVCARPEGTTVLVADGMVEAFTEVGSSRAGPGHEITLEAESRAPSEPSPAFDIRERLAWTREVGAREVPETEIVARRTERGLIALYLFDEGEGGVVHDSSGAGEPLDLRIADPAAVRRMEGGLAVRSPVLIASEGAARKVSEACMASNEITIEAWVRPAVPVQGGPARVVTLSRDFYNRNFALAHGEPLGGPSADFDVRLRTTHTDLNGTHPSTTSARGSTEVALVRDGGPAGIVHVVYTRDSSGWIRLYIDGEVRVFTRIGGDFSNWNTDYRLALANELIGERAWRGEYYLVAIYARALTPREVELNYRAGESAP